MADKFRKIIISRTDKIGDVVLSLPTFKFLKTRLPSTELIAHVSSYTYPIVQSSPYVNFIIKLEENEPIFNTVKKLRETKADAILFLYPRASLSIASYLSGIPVRAGTAYRWYSFFYNVRVREHRKNAIKSEAEYNLNIARALLNEDQATGLPDFLYADLLKIDSVAESRVNQFLSDMGIHHFVAVHPGSRGSAVNWPMENFKSLVEALTKVSGISVILTGSVDERILCENVRAGNKNAINTAGLFNLPELIALLSKATFLVSNSTGPIHIASCAGTPVIGLYPNSKPMNPQRWAPIGKDKIILTPPDGSDVVSKISVEKVLESCKTFLTGKL
ncbi:MAG: glycosyltransferase family 9 protein [Candidatus Kryptoniota bacterium]